MISAKFPYQKWRRLAEAYAEVRRSSNLLSFGPDIVGVQLDGIQFRLETGSICDSTRSGS